MHSVLDGLTAAAILILATAVLCGFGFLLWIIVTRAPESPLTWFESLALAAFLCALCLYGGSDG